jgi:hypothetical protein
LYRYEKEFDAVQDVFELQVRFLVITHLVLADAEIDSRTSKG